MLISLNKVSYSIGSKRLFEEVNLVIDRNERICLIGRNGAGKTTLLKLLQGAIQPINGEVISPSELRISQLEQTLPENCDILVGDFIKQGLALLQKLIDEYFSISNQSTIDTQEMERVQAKIEAGGGWNVDQQIQSVCSELGLDHQRKMSELSGGWRRRAALAKALVNCPELLLLDEPTNHLDLNTIEWLENRVRQFKGTVVFITHDRFFLQKMATRIVEIDRSKLISYTGDYASYLRYKEHLDEVEDEQQTLFNKRLGREEIWLRKGVKARGKRNQGRVRNLEEMRDESQQRIKRQPIARFRIAESSEISGRKVIEAHNLGYRIDSENWLFKNFDLKIGRGDRIGVIGNNGVGKSTLLQLLLDERKPDEGVVKRGTNLFKGYFDQNQSLLNLEKTVAYNVNNGSDYIENNSAKTHVVGYLKGFLFSSEQALEKAHYLSGGERNRLLLARLFAQPSNLLILDEPTNDLDIQMLEVLENELKRYSGTIIVVSHDRQFLDKVVDRVLVFEEDSSLTMHAGGYSDWVLKGRTLKTLDEDSEQKLKKSVQSPVSKEKKKLGYREQREWDALPNNIDALEKKIQSLSKEVASDYFIALSFEDQKPILESLTTAQKSLNDHTERWLELAEVIGL